VDIAGADSLLSILVGDASAMHDDARAGNDTLIGGDDLRNELYGDANIMGVAAAGGDDTLIGGDGGSTSFLYGDASFMFFSARGGNDTLISGTGTDHLWGDAQFINVGDVPYRPRPLPVSW
jgi:Ca2+-binding RTX toxin-like protein